MADLRQSDHGVTPGLTARQAAVGHPAHSILAHAVHLTRHILHY